MSDLVGLDAIEEADRLLDGVVLRTPLLPAHWLDGTPDPSVRLKCENLQRTGSFKVRGAFHFIARLPDADRRRGVITYSSGNHAQAVAFAASRFHAPATVVMPTTAPAVKVEGARRLGADVLFEGTTSTERRRRAEDLAARHGWSIVPPFDHAHIIAGQGTVGLETLRHWPDVDAVLVPVGGGGLISGIAAAVKRIRPRCRVIGVEPEGADAMRRSLEAGRPVTLERVRTIADGLAPVRPGDLTFSHAAALVDDIVTVTDPEIARAADRLLHHGKLLVEFSAAAALAALLRREPAIRDERTVLVLSGGNRDPRLPVPTPAVTIR